MEKETGSFPYLRKKKSMYAQKTAYLICITDARGKHRYVNT